MNAALRIHRLEAQISAHDGPNVVRTFDRKTNMQAVRVLPGAYYLTDAPNEMIVTVLGSCVAACVRDPHTGYGGLNHFMLPDNATDDWNGMSAAMRYGNFAMEALINEVLKTGCPREDLEIKLFGGANLQVGPTMIGTQNAEFARRYLEQEGLRLTAEDLGGTRGRRIHYFPQTGAVQRLMQKPTAERNFVRQEQAYGSTLRIEAVEGDIELFN